MALSVSKIEDAMELAITSLSSIAATGSAEEKIQASKVLLDACEMYAIQHRKDDLANRVTPLIDVLVRQMSGMLTPDDAFCPAMQLDPCQAGSLVMSLSTQVNK